MMSNPSGTNQSNKNKPSSFIKNSWTNPSLLPNAPLLHNFLGVFMRPVDLFTPTQAVRDTHPALCKLIIKRINDYVTARPLHCNDIIEHWALLAPLLERGMFSSTFSLINNYFHFLPSPAPPSLLDEVITLSRCLSITD